MGAPLQQTNKPMRQAGLSSGIGHRQRLKDRWLAVGINGFNEREQLELLLSFAVPRKDTRTMALQLLEDYGNLANVLSQPMPALQHHPGIGQHAAILLNLTAQLYRKSHQSMQRVIVRDPSDVRDYLLAKMSNVPEEKFYLLLLDQSNRILDAVLLEHGIENRAHIYLKKIVRIALDRHATGLICVHNHPSAQAKFSHEDIRLTERLAKTLTPLEIRLLDHFLVAGDQVLSMSQLGLYSPK